MKYTDPSGNLFKELFGPLGVALWPFNATCNAIMWLFDRKSSPFRNATNSTRELWAFGKSFDNFLAGKNNSGQKNGVTGQPGSEYTYTDPLGNTSKGYYFDN
jgi:hypothetical protein